MKGVIPWQRDPDWPHSVPEVEIELEKTALLVVDMQDPGNYGQASDNVERLLDYFRGHGLENIYLRVGYFLKDRRDMHPKRAGSWLLRSDGTGPDRQKGGKDHDIIDQLYPHQGEMVIDKNTTSAFNSSNLDAYLHARQVQNLVICGTATNHCVDNTARDAADRGYNVILVEDGCHDSEPHNHDVTVRTFRRDFGAVKSADQVMDEFDGITAESGEG